MKQPFLQFFLFSIFLYLNNTIFAGNEPVILESYAVAVECLKGNRDYYDPTKSQQLQIEARTIAAKMGVQNSPVRVFYVLKRFDTTFCAFVDGEFAQTPVILLQSHEFERLGKAEQNFVLAHETAHTVQMQMRRWGPVILGLCTCLVNPVLAAKASEMISTNSYHYFSRWDEKDADLKAARVFGTAGGIALFERYIGIGNFQYEPTTHPTDRERIQYLKEWSVRHRNR